MLFPLPSKVRVSRGLIKCAKRCAAHPPLSTDKPSVRFFTALFAAPVFPRHCTFVYVVSVDRASTSSGAHAGRRRAGDVVAHLHSSRVIVGRIREGGEKNVLGIKCHRRSVRGPVSDRGSTKRGDSVPCWLTRAPGISPRPGLGVPNRTDAQHAPIHAHNPPRNPPRVHSTPNNRQACPALIPRFHPSNKARKPHLESQPHRRLLHPTSRLLLIRFSVLVVTQATLRGCNGFGRSA